MPELSRFFGLVILMYYRDHPPPHFHVRYGEQRALIDIGSLTVLQGRLRRWSEPMLKDIVAVEIAGPHRLRLTFEDGVSGEVTGEPVERRLASTRTS
jgi:hypothetical protein